MTTIGVVKGHTRSLDYGSYGLLLLGLQTLTIGGFLKPMACLCQFLGPSNHEGA